jgi:integrase
LQPRSELRSLWPYPAPVAQGIERRFPKPCVAGSNPAGGAKNTSQSVVRNVAQLANAPSLTTARSKGPEMRVWSPAQLATFLSSIAGNRNEALFRLAALTGMRRSEVVGLRWSDVDIRTSSLTVSQAVTVVDGKELVNVPKTRRSRRVIDVDAETFAVLLRHRAEQREQLFRLGVSKPDDDRVFTNENGDPIRPNSVGQAFRRLVESAGVPRIRLHDLRHTHASHLLMASINVKVVTQHWVRHHAGRRPEGSVDNSLSRRAASLLHPLDCQINRRMIALTSN